MANDYPVYFCFGKTRMSTVSLALIPFYSPNDVSLVTILLSWVSILHTRFTNSLVLANIHFEFSDLLRFTPTLIFLSCTMLLPEAYPTSIPLAQGYQVPLGLEQLLPLVKILSRIYIVENVFFDSTLSAFCFKGSLPFLV